MNFKKLYPRDWQFSFAQSGTHPNWALDNARNFAIMAQEIGIEPWRVFPGSRQVMIESYDNVTSYQVNLLAERINKDKNLSDKVERVWSVGADVIYIDYIGRVDSQKVAEMPDFNKGDKLEHLVSEEILEVIDILPTSYVVKYSSGYTTHVQKDVIKCQYRLVGGNKKIN